MKLLLIFSTFLFLFVGNLTFAQTYIWADTKEGCVPLTVIFAIDTNKVDMDTINQVEWGFGNGTTLTADKADTVSTIYQYDETRNETELIDVSITFLNTIQTSANYSGYIKTHNPLDSSFKPAVDNSNDLLYTFTPNIEITDTAANYTFGWEYWHGDDLLSAQASIVDYTNPENAIDSYEYPDTGSYSVTLNLTQIKTDYTCESTTTIPLVIAYQLNVGNVFSPETTSYFIVNPENADVVLSFKLFTRTGLIVFEQEAPIIYWDGRNNAGLDLGTGVYFYTVEAIKGETSNVYSKSGFIHLFR
jgi:hypothetical protein